jgi:hypothetical protein
MPCQLFRLRDYETEIGVCFNFAVKFPIRPPPGSKPPPLCSESEPISLPASVNQSWRLMVRKKPLKLTRKRALNAQKNAHSGGNISFIKWLLLTSALFADHSLRNAWGGQEQKLRFRVLPE